jgi:hypothetical protein
LYGLAQTYPLPFSNFRWLKKAEREAFDISALRDDESTDGTGFIIECDLRYPKKLHKAHDSFPLAPLTQEISEDMLSPTSKKCYRQIYGKQKYSAKKLCATFLPRKKYVLTHRNLATYVKLGLEVTKIHRVLAFQEKAFIKPYIEKCTSLRQSAKNDFGKRLWKLFVNSVFGKFLERAEDYLNVSFCRQPEKLASMIARPNFHSFKIISKDLVSLFYRPKELFLNKPIHVGFSILDFSKNFLYNQFYCKIRKLLPECEINVAFSDTDSLFLTVDEKSSIKPFNHLERLKDLMDFSNYDKSSPLYSTNNASVLGFFKDEVAGAKIRDYVGVRSKTYCFRVHEGEKNVSLKSKCKGVTKGYRKTLTFRKFKKCVDYICGEFITQYHLRSRGHRVSLEKVNKLCYSSFDDKRYVYQCLKHTSGFGNYMIEKAERENKCPFC